MDSVLVRLAAFIYLTSQDNLFLLICAVVILFSELVALWLSSDR
jgi:hypothetical protein